VRSEVVVIVTERIDREEACRLLNTTPRALRQVWLEYGRLLGGASLPRQFDRQQLRRLSRVLQLKAQGSAQAEVAAAVAMEDLEEEAPPLAADLRERLESIAVSLSHNEARRLAEHDRVVTALMRTQQELSHLRYELASQTPRRDRRRPAWRFWQRGHEA
jgi:DNA-binding transcriptional MerR regulator